MVYESGEGGGKVIKGSLEAVSRLEIRGPKFHCFRIIYVLDETLLFTALHTTLVCEVCTYGAQYRDEWCNETGTDNMQVVSEPDPSHSEEEGSGHVPTFKLSPQNAIMCGN